jgi:hypothetical protein
LQLIFIGFGYLCCIVGGLVLGCKDFKGIANEIRQLLLFVVEHCRMNNFQTLITLFFNTANTQEEKNRSEDEKKWQSGCKNFLCNVHVFSFVSKSQQLGKISTLLNSSIKIIELQAVERKRLHPMKDMFVKSVNSAICVIPAKTGCSTNTPQGGTLFSPHAVRGILVNRHALSNRFSGVRHGSPQGDSPTGEIVNVESPRRGGLCARPHQPTGELVDVELFVEAGPCARLQESHLSPLLSSVVIPGLTSARNDAIKTYVGLNKKYP